MNDELRQEVRMRSGGFCEYCRVPEEFDRLPFQPDHIIAEKHTGKTEESNLAWSCYDCNIFKGPNVAGVDPESDEVTRLYHPRTDVWEEHFQSASGVLKGTTPEGRATIATLRINLDRRIAFRSELISEGVYPL